MSEAKKPYSYMSLPGYKKASPSDLKILEKRAARVRTNIERAVKDHENEADAVRKILVR